MKRHWLIAMSFFLYFTGTYSQNSRSGLFLKHYGLWNDPYLHMYVVQNIASPDSVEVMNTVNYFTQNRQKILDYADMGTLYDLYLDPKRFEITPEMRQKTNEMMASIGKEIMNGVVAYQEQKAQQEVYEAQQEVVRKAQQRQEFERLNAENKQKAAEFEAMRNQKYTTTSSTPLYSSAQTQKSNSTMTTSDMDSYMAIQFSNAAYGVEATKEMLEQKRSNEMLEQKRSYDYQQVADVSDQSTDAKRKEKIISAVTLNRKHIKIMIKSDFGYERITHYSNGLGPMGNQNWILVTSGGSISKPHVGSADSIEAEFSHTSTINGMVIYFDM